MRLIDKDELYEFLREKTEYESAAEQMIADLKNEHTRIMLDRFATVDAEPVRHGRWEECGQYDVFDYYQCSECGYFSFDGETNYCPNCGAKMDGESK